MNWIPLISDQFYNWSDKYAKQTYLHSSTKTKNASAAHARLDCCSAGLPHRTLQALWKTWVQLCQRPRPWSQVLPFGQQTGQKARDGLCSPRLFGKSKRASREFSQNKINSGGALRDQSRTPAAQGEALVRAPPCSLRGQCDGNVSIQCRRDCHSLCQYARRGTEKQSGSIGGQGGES